MSPIQCTVGGRGGGLAKDQTFHMKFSLQPSLINVQFSTVHFWWNNICSGQNFSTDVQVQGLYFH